MRRGRGNIGIPAFVRDGERKNGYLTDNENNTNRHGKQQM